MNFLVVLLLLTCHVKASRLLTRKSTIHDVSKFDRLQKHLRLDSVVEFEKLISTFQIIDAAMEKWDTVILPILNKTNHEYVNRYLEAVLLKLINLGVFDKVAQEKLINGTSLHSHFSHRTLKLILTYCRPSDAKVREIRESTLEKGSGIILGHVLDLYLRHFNSPQSLSKHFSVSNNPVRLCLKMHGQVPSRKHEPSSDACIEFCHINSPGNQYTMICGDNFLALGDKCPTDQIFRVIDLLTDAVDNSLHDEVQNLQFLQS